MRAQRPPHTPPAIDAGAEHLPFADAEFDASMAIFTVHQWPDLDSGLAELRRVTRGPVVVMTCDPSAVTSFWLNDYAPEVLATEAERYPALDRVAAGLGGAVEVVPMPVPLGCTDGFNEAYYGRPERLLDAPARLACSSWSFVEADAAARFETRLRQDLADGTWDRRWGQLRRQREFHGSLRLVISRPISRA